MRSLTAYETDSEVILMLLCDLKKTGNTTRNKMSVSKSDIEFVTAAAAAAAAWWFL